MPGYRSTLVSRSPIPPVQSSAVWIKTSNQWNTEFPDFASERGAYPPRSSASIPLLVKGSVLGTIGLSFSEVRSFSDDDKVFAISLAQQCAQALERARLYEAERAARDEAESSRRRFEFLAQASITLSSSLDYWTTLASVARLAVPHIADWCSVYIVDESGIPRLLEVAHVDPEKVALAHELDARYPFDPDAPRVWHRCFAPPSPNSFLSFRMNCWSSLHPTRICCAHCATGARVCHDRSASGAEPGTWRNNVRFRGIRTSVRRRRSGTRLGSGGPSRNCSRQCALAPGETTVGAGTGGHPGSDRGWNRDRRLHGTMTFANAVAQRLLGPRVLGIPAATQPETFNAFRPDGEPFPIDDLPLVRASMGDETIVNQDVVIQNPDGLERHPRVFGYARRG